MKKFEYKTTSGEAFEKEYGQDDPEVPEGVGWEMCGSAASESRLYWFWRRINPEFEKAQMEKIAKALPR